MNKIIKAITLAFLTLLSIHSFSQTDNIAVISSERMNIFYVGIDNPISIAVPNIPNDKIKVSINNGTITGSNGKYIVRVDKGIETTIEILTENDSGEIIKVCSKIFRVKMIPSLFPCFGKNCNSTMHLTLDELLNNTTISVSLNLFELNFEVISFTVSFYLKGAIKSISLLGNKFNQEIRDYIKQLDLPNTLWIENIKVKCPDGEIVDLPAFNIFLLEKSK